PDHTIPARPGSTDPDGDAFEPPPAEVLPGPVQPERHLGQPGMEPVDPLFPRQHCSPLNGVKSLLLTLGASWRTGVLAASSFSRPSTSERISNPWSPGSGQPATTFSSWTTPRPTGPARSQTGLPKPPPACRSFTGSP